MEEEETDLVEDVLQAAKVSFLHRSSKFATCLNYRFPKSVRCNNCSRFYDKLIVMPQKKRGKGRDSKCEQPWRHKNEYNRLEHKKELYEKTNHIISKLGGVVGSDEVEEDIDEETTIFTPPQVIVPPLIDTPKPSSNECDNNKRDNNSIEKKTPLLQKLMSHLYANLNETNIDIDDEQCKLMVTDILSEIKYLHQVKKRCFSYSMIEPHHVTTVTPSTVLAATKKDRQTAIASSLESLHPRKLHKADVDDYQVWWKEVSSTKKLSDKTYCKDASDLLCHLNIISARDVTRAATVLQKIASSKVFDDCQHIFKPEGNLDKIIVDNIRSCISHHAALGTRNKGTQSGLNAVLAAVSFHNPSVDDEKELSGYVLSKRLGTNGHSINKGKLISNKLIVENKSF